MTEKKNRNKKQSKAKTSSKVSKGISDISEVKRDAA